MPEGDVLPERKEAPKEVERKFLVDLEKIPPSPGVVEILHITQAYLEINSDGTEVRVRKTVDGDTQEISYELTKKSGGSLTRDEVTEPIDEHTYEQSLLQKVEGSIAIEKTRYKIPDGKGNIIELDIYEGELQGLITAEVEFSSTVSTAAAELKAQNFTPPAWFAQEVTSDKRYKNKNLALHGLPAIA